MVSRWLPPCKRNFHIFCYLNAGASPEERQHFHLLDKTIHFDQLKVALKTIGLSKRHVAQTHQLIAATSTSATSNSLSTDIVTRMLPSSATLMFLILSRIS
ncbi:hypothetical protein BD779DRAFT_213727 [Infundibulicybe gibba]|nr:hypothetical protein BD779DRAFT_213727 [Infundibulicybe gibba]